MDSWDGATMVLLSCVCCGSIIAAACLLVLLLRGREDTSKFRAIALAPVKPAAPVKPSENASRAALVQILQFAGQGNTIAAHVPKTEDHIKSKQVTAFQYSVFVSAVNAISSAKRAKTLAVFEAMSRKDLKTSIFKYAAKTYNNKSSETLRFICASAVTWSSRDLSKLVAATLPAVKASSLSDAMAPLSEDNQALSVRNLRALQSTAVEKTLANLARSYAERKWPASPAVPKKPPVQCPSAYGYYNCTDPRFNNGWSPTTADTINKTINYVEGQSNLSADQFCCKFSNIKGDMRPKAIAYWKDDKKAQGIFMLGVTVLLSIGFGNLITGALLRAVSGGQTSATWFGTAFIVGASAGVEESLTNALQGVIKDATGSDPGTPCYRSSNAQGSPVGLRSEKFKDVDNKDTTQFFQNHNNCPLLYAVGDSAEYAVQVAKATQFAIDLNNDYYGIPEANVKKSIKDAMVKFEDFKPGHTGAMPIMCFRDCPGDNYARSLRDTSGKEKCPCWARCTHDDIGEEGSTGRCGHCGGGGEFKWKCGQGDDIRAERDFYKWNRENDWRSKYASNPVWSNGYGTGT